jgi:hypothetical protein
MGCGGSKVDLDTFLTPQPKSDRGELCGGLVGDVSHTPLKCTNIFDMTYGTDPRAAPGRADPMKLQWNGMDAGTIEVQAGTVGGIKSFPKCWSSTIVCKDKGGKVVAQMEREDATPTKKSIDRYGAFDLYRHGIDLYETPPAIVYCARQAHDGQVASPNGMFVWALIHIMKTPSSSSKMIVEDKKKFANFGVFPLSSDGVNFEAEPTMLIVRGGAYAHVMNGDRSQNVGVASHTAITAAPGVDVLLMALLMLEFKMRVSSSAGGGPAGGG